MNRKEFFRVAAIGSITGVRPYQWGEKYMDGVDCAQSYEYTRHYGRFDYDFERNRGFTVDGLVDYLRLMSIDKEKQGTMGGCSTVDHNLAPTEIGPDSPPKNRYWRNAYNDNFVHHIGDMHDGHFHPNHDNIELINRLLQIDNNADLAAFPTKRIPGDDEFFPSPPNSYISTDSSEALRQITPPISEFRQGMRF